MTMGAGQGLGHAQAMICSGLFRLVPGLGQCIPGHVPHSPALGFIVGVVLALLG